MISISKLNKFQKTGEGKIIIGLAIIISTLTYIYSCLNIMWCFKTKTPFLFSKRFRIRGCTGLWRYESQIKEYVIKKIMVEDRNLIDKLVRIGDNLFSYEATLNNKQKKREIEEPTCYICYRERSSVINFPCLHTGLCTECGFQSYIEKSRCPMCRQDIDKLIVYQNLMGRYRQVRGTEISEGVKKKLVSHYYA